MSRIKIAQVCSVLSGGGAERVIGHLCRNFNVARFDVTACQLKGGGETAEALAADGFDVVSLGAPEVKDYLSSLKLVGLVRRHGIQVLHTHDVHSFMDGTIASRLVRGLKHVHTFHFGNYPHLPWRYLALEYLGCRMADALVAVGTVQRKTIETTYRLQPGTMHTILNGVPELTPRCDEALRLRLKSDTRTLIGSISTFTAQKGLDRLLAAVEILKRKRNDFRVALAGAGPLRGAVEREARERGLEETVIFLGWLPDAANRVLPLLDIFVQSSLWEAMSMVILEAMSAGKPIVATTVGENPFVLENEKTGLLVPPNDVDALVAALERCLDDAALQDRLATAAREKYLRSYTAERMAAEYMHLYTNLVGSEEGSDMLDNERRHIG